MNRWLAGIVLALAVATAGMGWRKALNHYSKVSAETPKVIAWGGEPVPPTPLNR